MAKTYYMRDQRDGRVFTTEHPEYHKDCEKLPTAEGMRLRKKQSAEELAPFFRKGATVYAIIKSVSRSGMSRQIDFYALDPKAEPGSDSLVYLSGYMADVLGWSLAEGGAIRVNGCGMDMVFHTIYTTVYRLKDLGAVGDDVKDGNCIKYRRL